MPCDVVYDNSPRTVSATFLDVRGMHVADASSCGDVAQQGPLIRALDTLPRHAAHEGFRGSPVMIEAL